MLEGKDAMALISEVKIHGRGDGYQIGLAVSYYVIGSEMA